MKNNIFLTIVFLFALSFILPQKSHSQIIEVGASADLSYYIGDVNPSRHFAQSNLNYGAVLRYYDNLRWAFRFQYSNFNLNASDKVIGFRPERAMSFESKVNDFAFLAEFNYFDYWTGSSRNRMTPYMFAGISVLSYNTLATEEKNAPEENITKKLNDFSWSVPFGFGFKASLSKRLGMTAEWRIHKTFTDKIDNIDGKREMFGYKCDWFGTFELSLVYRFNLPRKEACYSGANF